jgi:3-hydroxyisobutyrate dehydrogenase
MGTAMVHRLLDSGHAPVIWNRSPGKAEPLIARGAQPADSPASVTAAADVVLTILLDDAAVNDVYCGAEGLLSGAAPPSGKIFVEMSTIQPETARRMADAARARGAALIDCPVSGTVGPAREGKLLGIAGGERDAFAHVKDVLVHLCRRVELMGPAGAGSAAKLAINLPLEIYWAALGEAMSLSADAGVDPKLLLDVMSESSGGPNVLRARAPKVLAALRGEIAEVGFDMEGMRKDLGSMLAVGRAKGVDMPITEAALRRYEQASEAGWGDRDASALVAFCLQSLPGRTR